MCYQTIQVRLRVWAAALTVVAAIHLTASAQTPVNVNFTPTGPGNWNDGANWSSGFVPEAAVNEVAVIGSNRSAFLNDTPLNPGGITIDAGTLAINSGGNLTSVPGTVATGNVIVGQGANVGNLIVKRGGSFSAPNLTLGGATTTQLTLGETGSTGTATLSVGSAALARVTQIIGPNVNFTASGEVSFAGGTYAPVITGATHSTVTAGLATLSGVLKPQFSGYTPVFGNSWPLVTAGGLTGNFTIDKSLLPATPRGAEFHVAKTATTAALRYDNKLILTVNRGNGAVRVENVVGSAIAIDGYTVASPAGALGGTWSSLQDQLGATWDRSDNSSNLRRTEFKTAGTTSIAVGTPVNLGALYAPAPPAAIGQAIGEDITFQYSVPGQGNVTGIVEFVGARNNVVLTIDPTTGGAAIQNESPYFNVTIDAYTITSASGKLLTTNARWNSLADQHLSTWDEADNASATRLTEFNPQGNTLLAGGGTVLNLGTPVNISGGAPVASDFNFSVKLTTGQTLQGIVSLGTLPTFTPEPGDYERDGDVDGGDFVAWQRALGATNVVPAGSGADGNSDGKVDALDLGVWSSNFGSATAAAGPAAGATPEPGGGVLAGIVLAAGFSFRGRRRRSRGRR